MLRVVMRALMRIDLWNTGRRPWPLKAALTLFKWVFGVVSGPQLVVTYRPDLLGWGFRRQFLRASSANNPWPEGELELMGTLVSHLNACTY